jgi:hypothetical protein
MISLMPYAFCPMPFTSHPTKYLFFPKKPLPLQPQNLSVAQLVEQLTLNQWVPGSNPGGETEDKCKVQGARCNILHFALYVLGFALCVLGFALYVLGFTLYGSDFPSCNKKK